MLQGGWELRLMRKRILASAIVALFVVSLGWVTASADQGEMSAVIASGEIASNSGSGSFTYRPGVQGSFQPTQDDPLMQLRYRIWTLVGEPVWEFTGWAPRLASIKLRSDEGMPLLTILRQDNLPNGTVRWNEAAAQATVSADLMDLARIYDFSFKATVSPSCEGAFCPGRLEKLPATVRGDVFEADAELSSVSIYRSYQGILGQPGEWGWGVPGSPSWDETFVWLGGSNSRPSFSRDSFKEGLLGREEAKEVMRRLLHAYQSNGREPVVHLEVGDFRLNIHDLMRAIRKAEPEALHAVHGIHSSLDARLSEIIEDHFDKVRRHGLKPALEKEREEIEKTIPPYRELLSDQLFSDWKALRDHAPEAVADERAEVLLRELAPAVTKHLADGRQDLAASVSQQVEEASTFFAEEPYLSEAMKARWYTLQSSLNLGVGQDSNPGVGQDLIGGRIRVNDDCTFTDVTTNLQWTSFYSGQTCRDGEVVGEPEQLWYIANNSGRDTYPTSIDYVGHSDWRRPSFSELVSLIFCPYSNETNIGVSTDYAINNRLTSANIINCEFFEKNGKSTFTEQFINPQNERIEPESISGGGREILNHFDSVKYLGEEDKQNLKDVKCWEPNINSLEIHANYYDWECETKGGYTIWVRDNG